MKPTDKNDNSNFQVCKIQKLNQIIINNDKIDQSIGEQVTLSISATSIEIINEESTAKESSSSTSSGKLIGNITQACHLTDDPPSLKQQDRPHHQNNNNNDISYGTTLFAEDYIF